MYSFWHRNHIPEQQGLRQNLFLRSYQQPTSQKSYSRTTRIKTNKSINLQIKYLISQKSYSRTTRIKTVVCKILINSGKIHRNHIPEQQGLRQSKGWLFDAAVIHRNHIPEQQGLRLLIHLVIQIIRVNHRNHIPEQQGLRLSCFQYLLLRLHFSQKSYSRTTRIKTAFSVNPVVFNVIHRNHIPEQQGLRLLIFWKSQYLAFLHRNHIPEQQGLRHLLIFF